MVFTKVIATFLGCMKLPKKISSRIVRLLFLRKQNPFKITKMVQGTFIATTCVLELLGFYKKYLIFFRMFMVPLKFFFLLKKSFF